MSHKKILEGILEKRHSVVVKIADTSENIKIEYDTYEKLSKAKVHGIVHYYCYFECKDDIKKIGDAPNVCTGPGSTLRILVMEYVRNKSLQEHAWKVDDKVTIKSCIKQVICTALDAFLKTGFVHGDLHCNNVLIKPTAVENINYGFVTIPVGKYKIKLMDFEFSKFNQEVSQFFKDIKFVFATSLTRYIGCLQFVNVKAIDKISIMTREMWETSTDPLDVLKLLPVVDEL